MAMSPQEVVESVVAAIVQKRWDELPQFYAPETDVRHPFAIPAPTALHGRESLVSHFEAAAGLPIELEARSILVHQTTDPEVVVAEYEYRGKVVPAGREFTVGNIVVWRVRDGQIIEARDYANHHAFAEALGRKISPD